MKTITFIEKNYSITLKADDIVATTRSNNKLHIFMRGCDAPFVLTNQEHFDEWYDVIWNEES